MFRSPPAFLKKVAQNARESWDLFEQKPELAAPWWQLFKQLRSDSRHVISELLQNADDAGATWAKVRLEGDIFRFEHNGRDFDQNDFESLCRFAYSDKRHLHTIGYRGIGFKTTFSLGDQVELYTPTLAVAFHAERFTEPVWIDGAPKSPYTEIRVAVDATEKVESLRRYLDKWCTSPIPLLFFRNIRRLELNGTTIEKTILGPGPVENSSRTRLLTGARSYEVLHIWSEEEVFPRAAVEEIRNERGVNDDFDIPPTRVEIICRQPGSAGKTGTLYVVLPTNVAVETPFSCNAPFIQDPARTGIKAPSVSPTNRWLLERIGKLAAKALQSWLSNKTLDLEKRATAYKFLLPASPQISPDTLGEECSQQIIDAFEAEVDDTRVLLSTDGHLHPANTCLDLPPALLEVWTPEQNLELFGRDHRAILASQVAPGARKRLAKWGWLEPFDADRVLDILKDEDVRPFRPKSNERLLQLWGFVEGLLSTTARRYSYYYTSSTSRLAIVPVRGCDRLYPLNELIVLGRGSDAISQDDWEFLANYVRVVDTDWLKLLDEASKNMENHPDTSSSADGAVALLQRMELSQRTGVATAIDEAAKTIFARRDPGEAGIHLAYLAARADIRPPDSLRFLCEDGEWRTVDSDLLYDMDPALDCLPEEWLAERLVSERYRQAAEERDRLAWRRWTSSEKSRLLRFPSPKPRKSWLHSKWRLERRIQERGGRIPESYRLKRESYPWEDYDFDSDLVHAWEEKAQRDPAVWNRVALGIARAWNRDWRSWAGPRVYERGTSNKYLLDVGSPASAWLHRLQQTKCLPDRFGKLHLPSTIYRFTPDTAHLEPIEPFLAREYDRREYEEFLDLLGVQSKPGSVDKLLDRIRALAQSADPPRAALIDLYRALDRSTGFLDFNRRYEIKTTFAQETLIFASDGSWCKAQGVFQRNSDDLPDIPTVWPDLAELKLWDWLGVPREPTLELLIDWLKTLPSGKQLSKTERKRVRKILARAPEAIWRNTGHWLSIGGEWVETSELRWSASSPQQASGLFSHYRRQTGDVSMLSAEARAQDPFNSLPDLDTVVQHRVDDAHPNGPPFQPLWLPFLAEQLLRIRWSEPPEDGSEAQSRPPDWKKEARRLHSTHFQKVGKFTVIPYIEGQPAGPAQERTVGWVDTTLFLSKEGPAVHDELAEALTAPFPAPKIRQAIMTCVDRPPEWIASYFENHFDLEVSPPALDTATSPGAGSETFPENESAFPALDGLDAPTPETTEGEEEDEPGPTSGDGDSSRHPRRKRGAWERKIQRFWRGQGFIYDEVNKIWVSPRGVMRKNPAGGLFRWVFTRSDGTEHRYWLGDKSLAEGVQIPSEIWRFIQRQPAICSIVLPNREGELEEIPGKALVDMVAQGRVKVFPATYRIRLSVVKFSSTE